MGRGLLLSLLLHLGIGVLLALGLVRFGRELPLETAISVEIVSFEEAEAPPAPAPPAAAAPLPERVAASPPPPPPPAPEPEPEPEPEPPPPPPPAPPPPPPPPPAPAAVPEPTPAPAPPPPEPRIAAAPRPAPPPPPKPAPPKPVAEKPPEPPKPEPPKPEPARQAARPAPAQRPAEPKPAVEPKDTDFAALLRSVEQLDRRVQAPETREGRGTAERSGTQGTRPGVAQISASELATLISQQVTPCWRIPIGAQGVGGMRAEVNIHMAPDGNVQAVIPLDEARIAGDPVYRAFAESAVRAVRACSPLKLPPEAYAQWRNVIFNFDPSMLAG